MNIKHIHLQNYKRFTDLRIEELPASARLVVLIGPNGSGKSSLFDAFLFKGQNVPQIRNASIDDYYLKKADQSERQRSDNVWNRIAVSFHGSEPQGAEWHSVFNIRSPYRNEPDLRVQGISSLPSATSQPRFSRIIDDDQAVLDNYQRLAWQRLKDLDSDAPDNTTFGTYRATAIAELQSAVSLLFPDLALRDFSGVTTGSRGFRFAKGTVSDFPYKNLSGGEKGAFDLLLDMFVKRSEYGEAIYCIDEPEAHVAVAVQGRLLEALLALLPQNAQMWIATHSVGFVRAASQRLQDKQDVVFLDFTDQDFDEPVTLRPKSTSRSFWRSAYQVALDDLAVLVGPERIVLCEGNRDRPSDGFDAKCYSKLFADGHGDTLFLSRGSAGQVENSDDLAAVIKEVVEGVEILRLIDRDDMTDDGRDDLLTNNPELRVLRRRELENYLYDSAVLQAFFERHSLTGLPTSIQPLLVDALTGDARHARQSILVEARRLLPSEPLGRDSREFELSHLVPALRATESVYRELEEDIFP